MNFKIIKDNSHKNFISESLGGVYMVSKRNVLKEFRWGKTASKDCDFKTGKEAHKAMLAFIESRKDYELLHVTVLEFKN